MGQKSPRMRVSRKRGFSLAEIGVVMGILAIILGLSIPAYVRYRSHQTVNRALEMTEDLAVRAKEEAKSSGFALSDKVRPNHIASVPNGYYYCLRKKTAPSATAARARK